MTNSRSTRMRLAAAAGSLALAATLVAAPVAMAQDDGPTAPIFAALDAIEAKDLDSLPMYFCAEQAEEMGGLDFGSIAEDMPPGMDIGTLLDAFIFDVEVESAEVISETETDAVVNLVGSMAMDINADALGPFIEVMMGSLGEEVTPDMTQMVTGLIMSEFEAESTDISADIVMTRGEDEAWLICSDLTGDAADGDAVDPDAAETVDEGADE